MRATVPPVPLHTSLWVLVEPLFRISRLAAVHPSSVLALDSVLAGGALDALAHAGAAPGGVHGASAARRLVDRGVRWPTVRDARESEGAARQRADVNFSNFLHNFYLGMHCR